MEIGYTNRVNGKEIGKWIERQFLEWQTKHGRSSIKNFAEFLGVGRSYLTMLMNGERSNISYPTALMICNKLNNYDLLDILGYEKPEQGETITEISYEQLPEQLGQSLSKAMSETNQLISEGLDPSTDEGERLIIEIFQKQGFTYEPPRKKKS